MNSFRLFVLALVSLCALALLPIAWAEPEPTPTPTPNEEPTPTPHEEPTPNPEPGDDNGGHDNGGDDQNSDDDGEHGDLSLHGFYQGTTADGALAVFYVENNTHVQINILDFSAQQIGFAEGTLSDGAFSFTLTNGQPISGTANEGRISGLLANQSFIAPHSPAFSQGSRIGGRYVGVAHSSSG